MLMLIVQRNTNIMAGPGEEYITSRIIPEGTLVRHINKYGDWYLVQDNKGKYFWLSSKDSKLIYRKEVQKNDWLNRCR